MAVFDLFSKRRNRQQGKVPDVFTYGTIPTPLRVQIAHIWKDAFGDLRRFDTPAVGAYRDVEHALAREFGLFTLRQEEYESEPQALVEYFIKRATVDQVLDIIELTFKAIILYGTDEFYRSRAQPSVTPAQAIEELNSRFLEHGVGYSFVSGQLVEKSNEILHVEVVLPALHLLHGKKYAGANDEYLRAHEHYRHGRYKECLNDCLKAFESVMKTVCKIRNWSFNETDTAKTLIDVCLRNGLIPPFLQSQYAALRTCLETGVPTVRNRLGGHGQGPEPQNVPRYFAAYLLHLTAATITLLIEAEEDLK